MKYYKLRICKNKNVQKNRKKSMLQRVCDKLKEGHKKYTMHKIFPIMPHYLPHIAVPCNNFHAEGVRREEEKDIVGLIDVCIE